MVFRDWFFKQFPNYYHERDTYLDSNREGLFQRYLRVFGVEIDDEIYPYIENFMNIVDVVKCDSKFLPLIAGILGSPPSLNSDPESYRKVLAYIIAIYKVKGTKRSFEIFFNLLGLQITILEETPKKGITYDLDEVIYDEEPDMYTYDSECDNCSGYYIGYNSNQDVPEGDFEHNEVDPDILLQANNIICFLQPINAKFLGYVKGMKIKDSLTGEGLITETVDTEIS